jgi:hypothetical protein
MARCHRRPRRTGMWTTRRLRRRNESRGRRGFRRRQKRRSWRDRVVMGAEESNLSWVFGREESNIRTLRWASDNLRHDFRQLR